MGWPCVEDSIFQRLNHRLCTLEPHYTYHPRGENPEAPAFHSGEQQTTEEKRIMSYSTCQCMVNFVIGLVSEFSSSLVPPKKKKGKYDKSTHFRMINVLLGWTLEGEACPMDTFLSD